MRLIRPSYEILTEIDGQKILKFLELCGRVCYKSEGRITGESAPKFCGMLLNRKHLSAIEHFGVSVRFIVDRGVTHELVRHRLCSFSQESTRYCNYAKSGITFIIPPWADIEEGDYSDVKDPRLLKFDHPLLHDKWAVTIWLRAMLQAEKDYNLLLDLGWTPQQARSVLPNSLKTEIITTANLREWRHIFTMRTPKDAHPQMQEIMQPLLKEFKSKVPVIFDDL